MRTKILIIFTVLLLPLAGFGQFASGQDAGLLSGNYSFLNSTPKFNLQLGSGFSYGPYGGFFTNTINPQLAFHPAKRLNLMVGSMISSTGMTGAGAGGFMNTNGSGFYSTTFYALGSYQVNPRLTITGAAWTERNNLNAMLMTTPMNSQAFDLNNRGMMMGMEYRLGENVSIGAQVRFSDGVSPFSPYYNQSNSSFYSPFRSNDNW